MGQALYRKYRSKSLDEIVGQEHITSTLSKALESGRISHAYLFTGPRGVGKTSIARIFAHAINALPYDEQQTHLDIIEIDAASNRRIDEIRDLRDKVHIAPAGAKYKVYIIDEVHMLTKEAFNALLKTLEEPPAHAVFILATTESHKVPATIISRTQRYIFRPIEPSKAVAHLRSIAEQESITIDDAALELLAQHGDGSFRDSISLLDQAASLPDAITEATVRDMLGIPSAKATAELLTAIEGSSSPASLIGLLSNQYDHGLQAVAIANQLSASIRQSMIDGSIDTAWANQVLAKLLDVGTAADPERYLEIVLVGEATPTAPITSIAPPKAQSIPELTPATAKPKAKPAKDEISRSPETPVKEKVVSPADLSTTNGEAKWPEVLAKLKKDYNTLYGIVRMARPDFSQPGELGLAFAFAFHQKRVREAKNQQAIAAAIEAVYGQSLAIHCTHDPDLKLAAKPTTASTAPVARAGAPLDTISNIFGEAEVLE